MKKFIITVVILILAYLAWDTAYYRFGFYIDFNPDKLVETFVETSGEDIYINKNGISEKYIIKGVNMGVGLPGKWATDYAIDKNTYLRWFKYIKEMGANTIRVYITLQPSFYEAFYEYNKDNDDPLYLIHGVWVNDYIQNSHRDAYDKEFLDAFLEDCRTMVDVVHGKKKLSLGRGTGSGYYKWDISKWVTGYILGVEWEDVTVVYTDRKYDGMEPYKGKYMSATEDAKPFESMLAKVGDKIIEYESKRYKQQRLIAFSNWPTTDPFIYSEDITTFFMKCAQVDVEHIKTTDDFLSGQFASYHVYPYYPDYLNYIADKPEIATDERKATMITVSSEAGVPYSEVLTGDIKTDFYDKNGNLNTYFAYLKMLKNYHTMPVVISEFGVSTGRGMAQKDQNTGRNQGHMAEHEQGQAIAQCWEDIMNAGCSGGCIFTWQDEWFKRTWNTMHAVDLLNTPYWSDYQTNEQYFGLLSFDPGKEKSICYVDGDFSEWKEEDKVFEKNNMSVSMKYDEKFLYFKIYSKDFKNGQQKLYIPIDTTQKSGSNYCSNYNIKFERDSDFVICIDGKENSRILVQERYENLRAMFYHETNDDDAYLSPPDLNTPVFKPIELMLQTATPLISGNWQASSETYETGKLQYGNANPVSPDYNSLSDFIFDGDYIELKLPWQLLNFANPSEMIIHDDYYKHYGIEQQTIDKLYIGIGDGKERIPMEAFDLTGWGKSVTYHERLKPSYYIVQKLWNENYK